MEYIKSRFFNDNEFAVEFHPKKEDYINNVENCLHMWVSNTNQIPYPNMKEFKSGSQRMIKKQRVKINGKNYAYNHYILGGFEIVNLRSDNTRPSWDVICKIKQEVFGDEVAVCYHGKKGDEISKFNEKNSNSIMIMKPVGQDIKTPPTYLVGLKGVSSEDLDSMTIPEILDKVEEEVAGI